MAKNGAQLKLVREEVKGLGEHMLSFIHEFREFKKEQSNPFDDKYERARELLSPLVRCLTVVVDG